MQNKKDSTVIAHCATPVETGLFLRCIQRDLENRQWEGVYPAIHDVATFLLLLGEQVDSVDNYVAKHGLEIPFGNSHEPYFDAVITLKVWLHAFNRLSH
jgi:hypothetical protein